MIFLWPLGKLELPYLALVLSSVKLLLCVKLYVNWLLPSSDFMLQNETFGNCVGMSFDILILELVENE